MACADRCGRCVYFDNAGHNLYIGRCHANPPALDLNDKEVEEWVRPLVHKTDIACRHFRYRTGSEDE